MLLLLSVAVAVVVNFNKNELKAFGLFLNKIEAGLLIKNFTQLNIRQIITYEPFEVNLFLLIVYKA